MNNTPHMSMSAIISRYSQFVIRELELDAMPTSPDDMLEQERSEESHALLKRREVLAYRASRLTPQNMTEAMFLLAIAVADFDALDCSEWPSEKQTRAIRDRGNRCVYRIKDWMIEQGGSLPVPIATYLLEDHLDPERREAKKAAKG